MDDTHLILPRLPEKLEKLHKEEERIWTESLLAINSEYTFLEHMDMIHVALDAIYVFTKMDVNRTDDDVTIQLLGLRLFNSSSSALALMLAGYYQSSVTLLRDILETGFLIDYLTFDQSKIKDWKLSNEKNQRRFSPSAIRKALNARDKVMGDKRNEIYKLMCGYAAHPTYTGFRFVTPSTQEVKIGPFFKDIFLKTTIEELVKRLAPFVLMYISYFSRLPPGPLSMNSEFWKTFEHWADKYLNIKIGKVDLGE